MDRNLLILSARLLMCLSLSARRAWIEIRITYVEKVPADVALRKESVDRNFQVCTVAGRLFQVALRKESVDRNNGPHSKKNINRVALRKESVDRNIYAQNFCVCIIQSLSARRAWIEIRLVGMSAAWNRSLSARRAWIEIAPNRRI